MLEMLKLGNLLDCLLRMNPNEGGALDIDDQTLLSYCRQVASGMAYLSSKAFVHRDLASWSLRITRARYTYTADMSSEKFRIKQTLQIADFGMSRDLMDENYYISHGGKIPVRWTAPEVTSQSMVFCLYVYTLHPGSPL